MRRLLLIVLLSLCLTVIGCALDDGLPPGVKNTQNPKDVPPSPEEAVKRFKPPPGFKVTLFAGEPEVMQPIAMDFDDRGRLWVAECYSYPNWQPTGSDRILIFEDTDGDGRHDRRTVFMDKLPNLSGLLLAGDGVYACCAPNLVFIPDRDHDDKPDGPPVVLLDGWSTKAKHNIVNGLTWGPDGWIYGCHGILSESRVGPPGTPDDKRTRLNCGIWRYQPTRKVFEVVAHGTTNPWGLDFDEHGEGFFTNCVIGHLWHLIPGAHYKRMYGQDYNPHVYELIDATSDHLHWGGGDWTSLRGGHGAHDDAGGGHAHCGAMIYLGDNWPAEYRNHVFTCNLHGNRINRDRLERHGCGYVGRHAPDFLKADNPWFRGTCLTYGPDGGVYVADWCDLGECHDDDGVHRSSGRIYKIVYEKNLPKLDPIDKLAPLDLSKLSDADLVQLQLHKNEWYVRHGRRLLGERAAAGQLMRQAHLALLDIFNTNKDPTRQLRALWALHVTGGLGSVWLQGNLSHPNEHVRSWIIRLIGDNPPPWEQALRKFETLAVNEQSGLVRLYLASALQRMPAAERWSLTQSLARHAEDMGDRCQPRLLWYGIESVVTAAPSAAIALATEARLPQLRRFLARRIAETSEANSDQITALLSSLMAAKNPPYDSPGFDRMPKPRRFVVLNYDSLQGLREGLRGRKHVPMPANWREVQRYYIENDPGPGIRAAVQFLSLQFDAPEAATEVRKTLADCSAPTELRTAAVQALVEKGVPDLAPTLFDLLVDEPAMRGDALRALAAYSHEETPKVILQHYKSLTDAEKQDAIATLAARPKYALALLDAIENKAVPRQDVSAFTARQMRDLKDKHVTDRLGKVWGQLGQTSGDRKAILAKYKELLPPPVVAQADVPNGRKVFERTCASCHILHGVGGKVGPDLTGSNRNDLHYVLENILDPSAFIGNDYRLTNFLLTDGRLVAGIIIEESARAVTVQTATERLVLAKSDIDQRSVVPISMMPEGLIDKLTLDELRDLVGYLARK